MISLAIIVCVWLLGSILVAGLCAAAGRADDVLAKQIADARRTSLLR